MRNNSTSSLQHAGHHSFKDFKQFMYSHEDLFDDILEKTTDVGAIIITAILAYMVILTLLTLNHANTVYVSEIARLICNGIEGLMYNTIQGFM